MVQPQPEKASVTPVEGRVHFLFDDAEIASSIKAMQLIHEGLEPVVFVPMEDVHPGILEASDTRRVDPAAGEAHFYTIKTLTADGVDAAWYFPYAEGPFEAIRDLITFGGDRVTMRISEV